MGVPPSLPPFRGVDGNGMVKLVPGMRKPALRGVAVACDSGLSRLSDEDEYRFSRSNRTPMAVRVERADRVESVRFNGAMDERNMDERNEGFGYSD